MRKWGRLNPILSLSGRGLGQGRKGRAGHEEPGEKGPGRGAANFCSAHREIFWTGGEKKTRQKRGNYTMEKLERRAA